MASPLLLTPRARYDGYGQQRELTEEEQAQQDLRDANSQIRQVRDESLASGLRSLQMIEQSEERREALSPASELRESGCTIPR